MLNSLSLLRTMNGIHEEDVVMAGNTYFEKREPTHFRVRHIISFALAAALILGLGAAAYAATNWFSEYRSLKENPELQQKAEQGVTDLQEFTGSENFNSDEYALYEDGDQGQSDTTMFFYNNHTFTIDYYGSGEIHALDARDNYMIDHPGYTAAVKYWEDQYPDAEDYKAKVEAAAPDILDQLHADGWIIGDSSIIERVYCNERMRFMDDAVDCRVLMTDGTAYELWLQPDTFEVEGFMYWKAEDTPNTRNGFFTALHEGTEEQWWDNLQNSGVG